MLKRKIGVELNSSDANTYGETLPKKKNVLVTSVLTVALVWLLVGSATVAVAASASGNDPGASTFEEHCATCHAPNGSGDTVVGKSMKIPDLHSAEVQKLSDAQLADVIANGKGLMPGFKSNLSKDEIDALVKHVHQLAGKKAMSQ
jgi:mono/diheme cytochrome c family protein